MIIGKNEDKYYVRVEVYRTDITYGEETTFSVIFRDMDYLSLVTYKFDQNTMDLDLFNLIEWDSKYVIEIDQKNKKLLNLYKKQEVKE